MRRVSVYLVLLLGLSCTRKPGVIHVAADDARIRYAGRINFTNPLVPEIYWSGTAISVRFSGDTLRTVLKDEHGWNYFNVAIDGDSLHYIHPDTTKTGYVIAAGLDPGEHTVSLIKRNEYDKGKTYFYGFEVSNGQILDPPAGSGRIIEFIGNSITAGYAIEDTSGGDSPDTTNTNNFPTYAAITARHFNADLYCTAKSGIGILVSWFPTIMPEVFDRLDPLDSTSTWDFGKARPDLVVINLFQNDAWLVNLPDHPSFKQRFGSNAPSSESIISAYHHFVAHVRSVYPDTPIICALGSMDATQEESPWPGYINEAVRRLGDPNASTLFFPYMNKPGHPRVADNRKMADQLITYIEKRYGW